MYNSKTRQISIKVKEENYFKLLVGLGLKKSDESDIKEITLDLPDIKDIYKFLSTSDLVEDWDFPSPNTSPEPEPDDIKKYFVYRFTNNPNSHIILSILKRLLTIKKENPTVPFSKSLFDFDAVISNTSTREDIALETFIDGYNSMSQDVVGDLLGGLEKIWNFMDPLTLNIQKFVQKIYGVNRF